MIATVTTRIRSTASAGWSLIELLVVVSIIAILLGILINAAADPGPEEQTRATLAVLKAIAEDYETSTSKAPSHMTGLGGTSIERFCFAANSLGRTRDRLTALMKDGAAMDIDGDGHVDVVKDGWGEVVRYYDGAGAVTETGMPASRSAYFASSGPDGQWGTVNPANNALVTPATDNVFSFNLGR